MTFPIYGKIKNVPNHQPDGYLEGILHFRTHRYECVWEYGIPKSTAPSSFFQKSCPSYGYAPCSIPHPYFKLWLVIYPIISQWNPTKSYYVSTITEKKNITNSISLSPQHPNCTLSHSWYSWMLNFPQYGNFRGNLTLSHIIISKETLWLSCYDPIIIPLSHYYSIIQTIIIIAMRSLSQKDILTPNFIMG